MSDEPAKKSAAKRPAKKSQPRMVPTKEHRDAMTRGRQQASAVRAYLDSISESKGRGRRLSSEELAAKLEDVSKQLDASDDSLERLQLLQRRREVLQQMEQAQGADEHEARERRFVEVAAEYAERRGVDYRTWREYGVPASVLREAGITRS